MKLLLDNNLSPKLVAQFADIFPDSSHVTLLWLDHSSDLEVWATARKDDYTLVSKNSDFNDLLTTQGFPPKVIWMRLGNCTTAEIAQAFRKHSRAILDFGDDDAWASRNPLNRCLQ